MYTLCFRYTLDPNRLKHFRDYVEHELDAIRNAGGKIVGYWFPTDFAGPTNIAYGLIDFLTFASYEHYRKALASDPLHQPQRRRAHSKRRGDQHGPLDHRTVRRDRRSSLAAGMDRR